MRRDRCPRIGSALQRRRTCDSCSVGFAQYWRDCIRLRYSSVASKRWPGSSACAAVAVLARRGLLDEEVAVQLLAARCICDGRRGTPIPWPGRPNSFRGEFLS